MTKIQLYRSGGLIGKTFEASREVDLPEDEIIKALAAIAIKKNPLVRDSINYSIQVNDNLNFSIDINKAKGNLRSIIQDLGKRLKPR